MFETFIVQPIFNVLLLLYAVLGDFGLAIITFTVLVRVLMWPLLRKQLHQTRAMKKLGPEIKAVRAKYKGDKQKESAAMMELYKENGVNPVGTIGLLFVQLPVFFGLFSALRSFISDPARLVHLPYSWIRDNQAVQDIISSVADKTTSAISTLPDATQKDTLFAQLGNPVKPDNLIQLSEARLSELFNNTLVTDAANGVQKLVEGPFFDQHLFFVDLSKRAFSDGALYLPVLLIAVAAGIFQYLQTRQLAPKEKDAKSIKQILQDSAKQGSEPDQSEISAAIGGKMGLFFAPLITIICITSPAGLALYFAASGAVGYFQQRFVLNQDVDEMEEIADKLSSKDARKNAHKKKSQKNSKPSTKQKANKKGS